MPNAGARTQCPPSDHGRLSLPWPVHWIVLSAKAGCASALSPTAVASATSVPMMLFILVVLLLCPRARGLVYSVSCVLGRAAPAPRKRSGRPLRCRVAGRRTARRATAASAARSAPAAAGSSGSPDAPVLLLDDACPAADQLRLGGEVRGVDPGDAGGAFVLGAHQGRVGLQLRRPLPFLVPLVLLQEQGHGPPAGARNELRLEPERGALCVRVVGDQRTVANDVRADPVAFLHRCLLQVFLDRVDAAGR